MVPTDDGGLIQRYTEISWRFNKANKDTLPPHRSVAINLEPGYNLPYGQMYNLSELSRVVFTQLRGLRSCAQEPDHGFGFGLNDPMPYGRIDEWVFLMMDDMPPDGLWVCDEESMEDGH
jgi:hypothetical protein